MKFRWILLLALLLTACMPDIPETETPTEEIPIETEAPVVTEEPPTTKEPVATEAPLACVELLAPLDLADLPAVGKVTFEWTALEDAEIYLLNFTLPTGDIVTFETDGTTRDRYMEAFSMAGEFEWNVTALNNSEKLCNSDFYVFTKSQKPSKGSGSKGNGENSCVSDGLGGCIGGGGDT